MWKYSLKYSVRSFVRELVRAIPARLFVYPDLAKNEFSSTVLDTYVQQRLHKLGISPESSAPLIDKTDLRATPRSFLRPRSWDNLIRNEIKTSGTSGQPLRLVQDLGCVIREEAFQYRQLRWIGYRHGQRRAWIRGDVVCATPPSNGEFWCHDYVGKMLLMSSYHLAHNTIAAYVAELEKYDPVVIHAYPSSIAALSSWLKAHNLRYNGKALKGIMTSSETLLPSVAAQAKEVFGVQVYDWYGQAERVAAIGTCEHGKYHLLTDYSTVELMPIDNGMYEVVGTSLNNSAMRLQRYRTGDRVVTSSEACACGRVFPVIEKILGRQEKIITLPDGRQIGRLDHVFKDTERVVEGQIAYLGNAQFELRVVTASGFCSDDEAQIVSNFLYRVPDVQISVKQVKSIPRGANGKFDFIVVPSA